MKYIVEVYPKPRTYIVAFQFVFPIIKVIEKGFHTGKFGTDGSVK